MRAFVLRRILKLILAVALYALLIVGQTFYATRTYHQRFAKNPATDGDHSIPGICNAHVITFAFDFVATPGTPFEKRLEHEYGVRMAEMPDQGSWCLETISVPWGLTSLSWTLASTTPPPTLTFNLFGPSTSTGTSALDGWPVPEVDMLGGPSRNVSVTSATTGPIIEHAFVQGHDLIPTKHATIFRDRAIFSATPRIHWLALLTSLLTIYLVLDGIPLAVVRARRQIRGWRSRCRACGYSLTGLTASQCPECGAAVVQAAQHE